MPRHDLSRVQRKGGFSELLSRNADVVENIDFDVAVPSTFR